MKDKNKVISVISNVMFVILIITILGSAIIFARSDSNDKSIFGFRFYTVLTPSMTPTIPVGSMVFVKLTDASELKKEDIITYSTSTNGSIVVTHRVYDIIENEEGIQIITKGDANDVVDLNPVHASQVIGKVNLSVPYLGSFMEYIQKNLTLVIVSIVAVILILELVSYLLSKVKKSDKE